MKNGLKEAQKIFRRITNGSPDRELKFELEVHKKLLSFFQVGNYYYYIFNLIDSDFEFVSPEVESVLGYTAGELNLSIFLESIHPEDVPWFLNFENKVVSFFMNLRTDQLLKYKVRYDYRIKKKDGEYIRLLQQVVTIQYDERTKGVLRTFGVHTDISYLKKEGKPVLSLIGLEGEPSYLDIDVERVFAPTPSLITEREKQVLYLLGNGKQSKSIATALNISRETVDRHRKNMLRKTSATSTAELVAMAIRKGWI